MKQGENDARIWAKWFAYEELRDEGELRDALIKAIDHLPLEYLVKEFGADASAVYAKPSSTEVMEKARRQFGGATVVEG